MRRDANAAAKFRIFSIAAGQTLNISGLTISNGHAPDGTQGNSSTPGGAGQHGGGILNAGTLNLTNCVVTSNLAGTGGDAFRNLGGIGGNGGGIYSSGALNLTGCTVSLNSAGGGGIGSAGGSHGGHGGGIYNNSGNANVTNSIISDNLSGFGNQSGGRGGNGAGIFHNSGTMTLAGTTVSNNAAQRATPLGSAQPGAGGGINNAATMEITNCTISGNAAADANDAPASGGGGGGIRNTGALTLTATTIAFNRAGARGGGSGTVGGNGGVLNAGGTVSVKNSLIAGNTVEIVSPGSGSGTGPDLSGTFTSQGYNLVGKNDGAAASFPTSNANHDIVGTSAAPLDPKLLPLDNNGGTTPTHGLFHDSPAIDRGNSFGLTTDQRGLARVYDHPSVSNEPGDKADIGAFELQEDATPPSVVSVVRSPNAQNPVPQNNFVSFTVTFSEYVTGVDASDFKLTTTGTLQGASIQNVGAQFNSGTTYMVGVLTGTGSGTIRLDVLDDDTIRDAAANLPLGGAGLGNGKFETGEVYTVLPTLSITNSVTLAEGNTGTTTFPFQVSLTAPALAGGVTFDITTQDLSATTADGDYAAALVTGAHIPEGQQTLAFHVAVNGDTKVENFEQFYVVATNVSGAFPQSAQGVGQIMNDDGAPSLGQVIISEFRQRGPGTSPTPDANQQANDEFIELYNNSDSEIVVADSSPVDPSQQGWSIVSSDAPGAAKIVIPVGLRMPARGHLLLVNVNGYSLSLYPAGFDASNQATTASGDWGYTADIPDGAGLALYRTANPALFGQPAERLDAVGFPGAAAGFFETNPLQPAGGITSSPVQHSFVRRLLSGNPQDTGDNAADFLLVSTTGATLSGVQSQLGAPGPEVATSPVQRNAVLKPSLIDPSKTSTASPNRVRSSFGANATTAAYGTLSIQRRFTNTTNDPITRLRFRITDLTTLGSPVSASPQADLRVLSSTGTVRNSQNQIVANVRGLTLEQPPTQAAGGGLNSTLTVAIPGGSLASGANIEVQFLLGVQQEGNFRFFVNVEALPGAQPAAANQSNLRSDGMKAAAGGKQK